MNVWIRMFHPIPTNRLATCPQAACDLWTNIHWCAHTIKSSQGLCICVDGYKVYTRHTCLNHTQYCITTSTACGFNLGDDYLNGLAPRLQRRKELTNTNNFYDARWYATIGCNTTVHGEFSSSLYSCIRNEWNVISRVWKSIIGQMWMYLRFQNINHTTSQAAPYRGIIKAGNQTSDQNQEGYKLFQLVHIENSSSKLCL